MSTNYQVIPTPQFEKDISFLYKKRRYKKIEDDINGILEELEKGNLIGDEIAELKLPSDESVYKVRAANSSIKVGKSNGFRIIYYVVKNDKEIYLLTIYSKKDKENIEDKKVIELVKKYCM